MLPRSRGRRMEDGPTRTHTLHTIGKTCALAGEPAGIILLRRPQLHSFLVRRKPSSHLPPLAAASSAHTHIPRRGAASSPMPHGPKPESPSPPRLLVAGCTRTAITPACTVVCSSRSSVDTAKWRLARPRCRCARRPPAPDPPPLHPDSTSPPLAAALPRS